MLVVPRPPICGAANIESVADEVGRGYPTGFASLHDSLPALFLRSSLHYADYIRRIGLPVNCQHGSNAYDYGRDGTGQARREMRLPEFKSSRWKCISACGTFEGDDDATTERIADLKKIANELPEHEFIAKFGEPASPFYISLYPGADNEGSRHFHFDLIACDCLSKTPVPNRSIPDLTDLCQPFIGKIIKVNFSAGFWVSVTDLPPCGLILGCKVESKMGVMTIKQSSATFAIERGPIDRIHWSTIDDKPNILNLGLYLKKITTFDRDYLMSFYETAESVFDYLVLGKEINAERR